MKNRKYILVDLYSGSYNKTNIGFERFNFERNPVDKKYYGYVPPKDDPNIIKLGASKKDDYIDDILVIFVEKVGAENSTDRKIIGFYPSARVYKKFRTDKKLKRVFIDIDGTFKTASYSLVSNECILSPFSFVIKTRQYNSYMFRKQRVYSGTYPELDAIIYDYINRIEHLVDEESFNQYEDVVEQQNIQRISEASDDEIKNAPDADIAYANPESGSKSRIQRNTAISKSAIIRADYKCENDENHKTFLNPSGNCYMEGHHLIPLTVKNAEYIKDGFNKYIDCVENIVSLCPTCHRAIHFGSKDEKKAVLSNLIKKRLAGLKSVGINVTEEYLLELYGIK